MNFKNLKTAILNKSWDDVIIFYENITGESLENNNSTNAKKTIAKKGRPKKTSKKVKTKAESRTNDDDMVFYGGEDAEENEESKIAKKIAKGLKKRKVKQSRDLYQPNMVNCTNCNRAFDKNKDNSFTVIGESSGINKNLCNKCVLSR
jgi:hypothetical protein